MADGLMVFAVEAVVGSAFWAFSHVRADGGELVNQQQAYGYSILMNAIFRPLLTLVGLLFSSVIMAVMAQFVDETFGLAYENSGIGWMIDPVSILTLVFLLFYVHYQVAIRSLRVITLLPDSILKWIGSGQSATSYGELMGDRGGDDFGGILLSQSKVIPSQRQLKQAADEDEEKRGGGNGGGQKKGQPDKPNSKNNDSKPPPD